MIRIIGLKQEIFDYFRYDTHICRKIDENQNIIEFTSVVNITVYNDHIEMVLPEIYVNIMRCDFYRIEIE